ncbi:MAG: hypothetical protein EB084_24255, partial [Proteobacteria bacterium]|nr:hypothetical protein [Pseudomonadota bacterium]
MSSIEGRLTSDEGWGVPRKARLEASPQGIRITAEDGLTQQFAWSAVQIRLSLVDEGQAIIEGLTAQGHRYTLEAEADPLLAVVGEHAPASVIAQVSNASRGETRRRLSLRRALAYAAVIVATFTGLFAWSLSALPRAVAQRVPLSLEEELGKSTFERITKKGHVLESGPAYDAVQTIWKRLEPALPPSPYTYRIAVVNAPVVNAFAMPGGYIVVYTGLMEEIDSPEALAGILGHETSHVIRKHVVESLVRNVQWQVGVSLLWSLLGGSNDKTLVSLREQAAELQSLAHSRDHESEADRDGLETLQRAGIDPKPFSDFFLVLAKRENQRGRPIAILSTHPPSEDRAARL